MKWHVNWSGAIQAFPGLESLITDFASLSHHAQEQVGHLDQTVLAYFHHHPGANGSVEIDATVDPHGEHSATVTLAAVPQAGAPALTADPEEHATPEPEAEPVGDLVAPTGDTPVPDESSEGAGTDAEDSQESAADDSAEKFEELPVRGDTLAPGDHAGDHGDSD